MRSRLRRRRRRTLRGALVLADGLHHYEYTLAPVVPSPAGPSTTSPPSAATSPYARRSNRSAPRCWSQSATPSSRSTRSWRIVLVNSQRSASRAPARADTLGRIFWDVFPEARNAPQILVRIPSRHGRARRLALRGVLRAAAIWTEVRAYPTADGGISVFFRDVTAVKGIEDRLSSARGSEQKSSPSSVTTSATRSAPSSWPPAASCARTPPADPAIITRARSSSSAPSTGCGASCRLLDFTRARRAASPSSRADLVAVIRGELAELRLRSPPRVRASTARAPSSATGMRIGSRRRSRTSPATPPARRPDSASGSPSRRRRAGRPRRAQRGPHRRRHPSDHLRAVHPRPRDHEAGGLGLGLYIAADRARARRTNRGPLQRRRRHDLPPHATAPAAHPSRAAPPNNARPRRYRQLVVLNGISLAFGQTGALSCP